MQSEASLIPYLVDDGIRLRWRWEADSVDIGNEEIGSKGIEGAGPFSTILEGSLAAGGHGVFARLFLVVQPDHYTVAPSELNPVSNFEVDHLWQAAWERFKLTIADNCTTVFPEQIDEKGRLRPFRPLFYCRHKEQFAHALCPRCGEALTLCRDDNLLIHAGLPAYGKSLDRYLYCPVCHSSQQGAVFFTRFEGAGSGPRVKNCAQLIEGFSALLAKTELAGDLPCVSCDQNSDCYGPQTLVHQRMSPLFFYPFYMLMQPAASLNAVEFLSLLSGASIDRIIQALSQQRKHGRQRHLAEMKDRLATGQGRLFNGERRFLEVLYLKLLFLEELSFLVLQSSGSFTGLDAVMSLDGLWVALPEGSARLPLFWNFDLRRIDPVGRLPQSLTRGVVPMASALHFLGNAWCYALLVNERQDMAAVQKAVDRLLVELEDVDLLEEAAGHRFDPVFAPHHLLWQPPVHNIIDPQWESAWRSVLLLGLRVLLAGVNADPSWSENHFRQQLRDIKAQIHALMFQVPVTAPSAIPEKPAPAAAVASAVPSADDTIAGILEYILDRWPTTQDRRPGDFPLASEATRIQSGHAAKPNEDGDFEETIILESPQLVVPPPTRPLDLEETVVMGKSPNGKHPTGGSQEDDQATLIISSGKTPATQLPRTASVDAVPSTPDQPTSPDLEQTIVMGAATQTPRGPIRSNDDHPATMITSPARALGDPPPPRVAAPKPTVKHSSLVDALEKTVIQNGHQRNATVKPPAPPASPANTFTKVTPADDSEELEKTVILSPDKSKERIPRK